jgi:hypothetical protein
MAWLFIIPFAIVAFFGSFGWSFVTKYQQMSGQIVQLQHDIELRDGREASFRRMLDRRDAAIGASKCNEQIQDWVKNPDKIPKAFNPFNQLDSMGQKYGN